MIRVRMTATGPSFVGGGVSTFCFDTQDATQAQTCASLVKAFFIDISPLIQAGNSFALEPTASVFDAPTGTLLTVAPVSPGTGVDGANFSTPQPISTQGLIRLRTNTVRLNRVTQGRLFIGGVTDDAGDARPDVEYRTSLETAAARLRDESFAAPWCIWSRPKPGQPGDAAPITAVEAWSEFAVLRSRRD